MLLQADLPTELRLLASRLREKRPRVVIVAGTGVSFGATGIPHTMWDGLLFHGIDYLVAEEQLAPKGAADLKTQLAIAFSPFNLNSVLDHAEHLELGLRLGKPQYASWLRDALGSIKARDTSTLGAIRELYEAGALVLTTNYDSLLAEATRSDPVTWHDHDRCAAIFRGDDRGIIHLHGHWSEPESVILGRRGYQRITEDRRIQDLMKAMWLLNSWVYVGCGGGLGDPNLGPLLEWSRDWEAGTAPDFILTRGRPDPSISRPKNIVHFDYGDHSALPDLLTRLAPFRRAHPFTRIDSDFLLYRAKGSSVAVPSLDEYQKGLVPKSDIDDEVLKRLETYDWAFVEGPPSAGKTTLSLRIVTALGGPGRSSHYLDLNAGNSAGADWASIDLLARPGSLIILDNVNRNPVLANELWNAFADQSADRGKLLLVGTRTPADRVGGPSGDLSRLRNHKSNAAILLAPSSDSMEGIARFLVDRVAKSGPIPKVPDREIAQWRSEFGGELNAFCLAVIESAKALCRGEWQLKRADSIRYVRNRWTRGLGSDERSNLHCLAAFGTQSLEIQVPRVALPNPEALDGLLALGIVSVTKLGSIEMVSLLEPGWGELILEADAPIDVERIRLESLSRNAFLAAVMLSRWQAAGESAWKAKAWQAIDTNQESFLKSLTQTPLDWLTSLLRYASDADDIGIGKKLWSTIEADSAKLMWLDRDTSLDGARKFLISARTHFKGAGKDVGVLWAAFESDAAGLAAKVWGAKFERWASFLNTAREHGRDVGALWGAIEGDPDRLAAKALEATLDAVPSLITTAVAHKRDPGSIEKLWCAIESQPDALAARALETPLAKLCAFMNAAKNYERNIDDLWRSIEGDVHLAAKIWRSPIDSLSTFLVTAKDHGRDIDSLWRVIESDAGRLEAKIWESPLDHLSAFIATAKDDERDIDSLWRVIESDAGRLEAKIWESPLDSLSTFLVTAKDHGRDIDSLWRVIESDAGRLEAKIWESPLDHLSAFIATAKDDKRDIDSLWRVIESDATRLEAKIWESPLDSLSALIAKAKKHERNSDRLWCIVEKDSGRLVEKAKEANLPQLFAFLSEGREHGRETDSLWRSIADAGIFEARLRRLNEIVAFCSLAPFEIQADVLPLLNVDELVESYRERRTPGAFWIARALRSQGLFESADALHTEILAQQRQAEFPPRLNSSLFLVVSAVAEAPAAAQPLVHDFLKAICSRQWLGSMYMHAQAGSLANGLSMLALSQPEEIRALFFNPSARFRLMKEFEGFAELDLPKRVEAVRFLGMVNLLGWRFPRSALSKVSSTTLAGLPKSGMPHRPGTSGVERLQFDLWMGLHAFASSQKCTIPVDPTIILETLQRWREPVVEGTAQRLVIDEAMRRWLAKCAAANPPALVPDDRMLLS